jgi:hypothetical protein
MNTINTIMNILNENSKLENMSANSNSNSNSNSSSTVGTMDNNNNNNMDIDLLGGKSVQLSRYWLHKIVAFGRASPIDNLWLNCYHGSPLRETHRRRKLCSIDISQSVWNELIRMYGKQYNTQILIRSDSGTANEDSDNNSKTTKRMQKVNERVDELTTEILDENSETPPLAVNNNNSSGSSTSDEDADVKNEDEDDEDISVDMELTDLPIKAADDPSTASTSTSSSQASDATENNGSSENQPENKPSPAKTPEARKEKDAHLMKPCQIIGSKYRLPWELTEISDTCADCAREEISGRREYEKNEIRRLEEDGLPQDCALNMKWANSWRNFVHGKTDDIPGRIDNRYLHAGNHMVKDEFVKDTHYLMVPSNIWHFLIEHYGGGPKLVPINKAYIPPVAKKRGQQKQTRNASNTSSSTSTAPSTSSSSSKSSPSKHYQKNNKHTHNNTQSQQQHNNRRHNHH